MSSLFYSTISNHKYERFPLLCSELGKSTEALSTVYSSHYFRARARVSTEQKAYVKSTVLITGIKENVLVNLELLIHNPL